MTLASTHDALLLDLDGTVWEGGRAVTHAVETLSELDLPRLYVTNNASKAPSVVAQQLNDLGLSTRDADVITSAQAAIMLCAQQIPAGAKVLVLGTESFRVLAEAAGFNVVSSADDKPVAVLHGHNPETGWAQLSEAALAIRAGARYFASNVDSTLPMERGLHIGNGSMVAAVTHATGVVPQVAGKPEPAMFHLAARSIGAKCPLAVGDRLDTDIAGGVAAGMDTLQVITGVSGHWDTIAAPPEWRATYLAADMRALHAEPADLAPHPEAGFSARMSGADIVLEGGHDGADAMAALRTVLSVAWHSDTAFSGTVVAGSPVADTAISSWR
ncbi:HAD-IIA family hydrolase [Corynebacterium epidermidicanis]|uniref:Putative sugar phosphatase of HAD superfamily n=1 Tax=Corynebacterium epidermidicanis TaxID=1050174 RepID=A0A0G3GU06_9CORY|nr:HAD-IIA family hydrolase [Corynebacterium epidermidicanis]AKK03048.1 putative sugar phosphatase of HAD superfamily [Corynebacterium epidermidicanis]